MKKQNVRTLQLVKNSVAAMQELNAKTIQGGSEPVSPPMSQVPDGETICYAPR